MSFAKTAVSAVGILCAVCKFSAAQSATPFRLYTPAGAFEIQKWKVHNPSIHRAAMPRAASLSSRTYAYAIFDAPVPTPMRKQIEQTFPLHFLSAYSAEEKRVTYFISLSDDASHIGDELAAFTPLFFGLTPIMPEDRISKKIREGGNFAPGVWSKTPGRIFARVEFFPDFSLAGMDSVLHAYGCNIIRQNSQDAFLVEALPANLRALAHANPVRSIQEHNTNPPVPVFLTRQQLRVDQLQNFSAADLSAFPPDTNWLKNSLYTGDSIWVGIYDVGIDSTLLDFKEIAGPDTLLRTPRDSTGSPIFSWTGPVEPDNFNERGHGTYSAGMIAGNGWYSEINGGNRYEFRGMAPKALMISGGVNYSGNNGDVNLINFGFGSFQASIQFQSEYTPLGSNLDNIIYAHSNSSHIQVLPAGNSGLDYGYYSLWSDAKDPICVGGSSRYNAIRWDESSLGPTRDGRISPQVVTPAGVPPTYPLRDTLDSVRIDLDFVRLIGAGGVKKAWEFNGSN